MATMELTKDNLQETLQNNEIVIVDFWAPWCGPCKAFGPIFESASDKHQEVKFAKVNTDVEQELAEAFEIRSIPTLAVFKETELIFYQAGMLPEDVLEELVQKVKDLDMEEVRKAAPDEPGDEGADEGE